MAKSLDIIDPKRELGDDSPRREGEDERERDSEEEKVVQATQSEEHSGGLFYLIIGIIAVIVSASLALYILFKDNKSNKTPTASTSATASTAASGSSTASATESAAAAGTTTAQSSAFKYTNEQIRIANGNSKAGEAARIKTALEAKGYKIASTGNASKQYDSSIIYYKTGQEKLAGALKTDLAGEYTATIEQSDSTVGTYDAVVVLGAK